MTISTQPLTATPAAELDDDALRRELATTHQLQPVVEQRGVPRELESVNLRLAELDSEYLRRFPHAAEKWPWPLPDQLAIASI
ncbi:MAG TPA: hypothetical protein DGG94_02895 [Micromonosporaceae bacterium]|nr:hypothetical protein [Micromonosporaceae bacterium]HCU48766.1 hypothetical protein [Micromonosporaceae bacterium]